MAIRATGQLTLTDMNDAIISGTAPSNPTTGTLWIDESTSPKKLKKWSGTAWLIIGEVMDDGTGIVIDDIQETLGNMANDNILDIEERKVIKDRLTDVIGQVIVDTATALPTASSLDTSAKGSFYSYRKQALNAGLLSSDSKYIAVETKYNALKTYLEGLTPIKPWDLRDSSINISVTKATFRDNWMQYYQALEDLAEATAQKLKENVDNVVVGGTNYASNGDFTIPLLDGRWSSSYVGQVKEVVDISTEKPPHQLAYHINNTTAQNGGIHSPVIWNGLVAESMLGREITVSFWLKYQNIVQGATASNAGKFGEIIIEGETSASAKVYKYIRVHTNNTATESLYITGTNMTWQKYSATINISLPTSATKITKIQFRHGLDGCTGEFWTTGIKVELGNKVTDWSVCPYDLEGITYNTVFKVNKDNIISTVTSSQTFVDTANTALNGVTKVRYIRDWLNGSSANTGNHWVELKAMAGTTNRASGKVPTSNGGTITSPANYTNGDLTANNYASVGAGHFYLQIDLGAIYEDIDYIQAWHYYADGRTYNKTKIEISEDGITWKSLFDSDTTGTYKETSSGLVIPVNNSSLNSLNTRVSTAESSITQNAENIELKVSKNGVISSINASSEGVRISGNKIQIDGNVIFSAGYDPSKISVGGRNLLRKSVISGTVTTAPDNTTYATYKDISVNQWRMTPFTKSDNNVAYSISFWAKVATAGNVSMDICDGNVKTLALTTSWQFFKFENLTVNSSFMARSSYGGFIDFIGTSVGTLYLADLMLEQGTKCSSYSPAPEDVAGDISTAQSTANTANSTANSVNSTVTTNKGTWDRASNINSNGTFNTSKLSGTLSDSQIASATTWNGVNSLVNSWKSGTTLINGGMIATDTIIARQLALVDFNNLATVDEKLSGSMLPSSFAFGGTKIISGYVAPNADTQAYLMMSDFTLNPFRVNEEVYIEFEGYAVSAGAVQVNVWTYDSGKVNLGSNQSANINLTTSNAKYTTSVKLAHASFGTAIYTLIGFGSQANRGIRIKNFKAYKKNGAELIVDGTITANHIKSLNGLNINDKFIVDASGNVTFKGALSGATGSFTGSVFASGLTLDSSWADAVFTIRAYTWGARADGGTYLIDAGDILISTDLAKIESTSQASLVMKQSTGQIMNFTVEGNMTITKNVEMHQGLTTWGSITNGGFDFVLGTADQVSRGNTGASRALVKENSKLMINYANDFPGGVHVASKLFVNDWVRSYNSTGWYNETYGGGIWMNDYTWVKTYGNKNFMVADGKAMASDTISGVANGEKINFGWNGRILDASGTAFRLQWNNSRYIRVDSDGSFVVTVDGASRHILYGGGGKYGGSIEIDGHVYGMSPVDSPLVQIEDLALGVQLNKKGTKVYLGEKYSKAIDGYHIFPNNPTAIILEKTPTYFVVKGEGVSDFILKGIRRDSSDIYWADMQHPSRMDSYDDSDIVSSEDYVKSITHEGDVSNA